MAMRSATCRVRSSGRDGGRDWGHKHNSWQKSEGMYSDLCRLDKAGKPRTHSRVGNLGTWQRYGASESGDLDVDLNFNIHQSKCVSKHAGAL